MTDTKQILVIAPPGTKIFWAENKFIDVAMVVDYGKLREMTQPVGVPAAEHGSGSFNSLIGLPIYEANPMGMQRQELAEALDEALDTIVWMSGAEDFSPGHQAHDYWVSDSLPRFENAMAVLRRYKEETSS